MKFFISILFVLLFVLPGESREQINNKINVGDNWHLFIQNYTNNQPEFYSNVSDEQDTEDVDYHKTFGIPRVTSLTSAGCDEKTKIHFSPLSHHRLSLILLIDLPPPTH